MDTNAVRKIYRVTALTFAASIVFYLFFQTSKGGPLRTVNPFLDDPYDAVGSFAVQGALLVGALTYARALRLLEEPAQIRKERLILRGNGLVLAAIWATLIADVIAEFVRSLQPSFWGYWLQVELALMFLLAAMCTTWLAIAFKGLRLAATPAGLTPADGIDDLWTLARVPVKRAEKYLPERWVAWVESFNSDWLFARTPWLNPRLHAWRFACALGLLVGIGLVVAQLQEGLPPSLQIGLLVMGIFISAEFAATLIGFAVLGGYLGLRPAFRGEGT